jgi:hypothetical protein
MSKIIKLPCFGIQITLGEVDSAREGTHGKTCHTAGTIQSDLKEPCTHCGQPDCNDDCDGSQGADEENHRDAGRAQFNAAIDGIESLVLALAVAGVNVEAPEVLQAIESAVDAIGNQFGE